MAMIYTPAVFDNGSALTTTPEILYTVPEAAETVCSILKEVVVCNTAAVPVSYSIYAGGDTVSKTLFSGVTLQPNETSVIGLSTVLAPGETVKAAATANSVISCRLSGVEVTTA